MLLQMLIVKKSILRPFILCLRLTIRLIAGGKCEVVIQMDGLNKKQGHFPIPKIRKAENGYIKWSRFEAVIVSISFFTFLIVLHREVLHIKPTREAFNIYSVTD